MWEHPSAKWLHQKPENFDFLTFRSFTLLACSKSQSRLTAWCSFGICSLRNILIIESSVHEPLSHYMDIPGAPTLGLPQNVGSVREVDPAKLLEAERVVLEGMEEILVSSL